jgi:lipopolysaccharide export system permease protein
VQGVDGHKLIEPEIAIQMGEGERSTIIAKVGELKLIPQEDVLRVDLEDAIVSIGNSAEGRFHHLSHDISLDKAARKGRTTDRPANIAMHDLANETNKQRESIDRINELAATHVLMGLSIGRYDWLGSQTIRDANARRHAGQERLARLETEPYRRWACGFSCFCFVWLGIPLSIWYRTADYWFVFGVAFLPLLLIYYPLFMMALEQAKDGNWPPYSVWLGNLGILAAGCWFKHKVNYS